MTGTRAVPLEVLDWGGGNTTGQPLCPSCKFGRLHPFAVTFSLPHAPMGLQYTSEPAEWLEGWVAICVGNSEYEHQMAVSFSRVGETYVQEPVVPGCGFTMALTPRNNLRRQA